MRIAFFGGSFDPPHLGHIAVARAAQHALQLDRVLFAPVGLQPLKPHGSSAGYEYRVAMTRLAIANEPNFELSLADGPTPGNTANYTVDTLIELRQTLPPDAELFLLLGADALRSLPNWHRAVEIPFLASLIVAARPGEDLSDLAAILPAGITAKPTQDSNRFYLQGPAASQSELTLLPNLHYEVSATQLRQQIDDLTGTDTSLLNPRVLAYIHNHHLYR